MFIDQDKNYTLNYCGFERIRFLSDRHHTRNEQGFDTQDNIKRTDAVMCEAVHVA